MVALLLMAPLPRLPLTFRRVLHGVLDHEDGAGRIGSLSTVLGRRAPRVLLLLKKVRVAPLPSTGNLHLAPRL